MKKPRLLQGPRGLALVALLLVGAAALAFWALRSTPPATPAEPGTAAAMLAELQASREPWQANRGDLSRLIGDLREQRIASAALAPDAVYVTAVDGARYWVPDISGRAAGLLLGQYADAATRLFPLVLYETDAEARWYKPLVPYLPFALVLVLALVYLAVRSSGFQIQRKRSEVGFDDVIGASEAKQALRDVTAYLRDPQAYARLGARPPKGVLLTGEPGTGKTQLAKALAGEANASFIQVTGSDFSSMYFGVGIQKVKSLFRTARKQPDRKSVV